MKDWIIHFVKAKDIFEKKLEGYNIKEDLIEFNFGDHKKYYLFQKSLNHEAINKMKKYEKKTVVCEKNEENFKFLINNFEELANIENLVIIFLSNDKKRKLLINPKAHSRISDPKTLISGLESLWNNS